MKEDEYSKKDCIFVGFQHFKKKGWNGQHHPASLPTGDKQPVGPSYEGGSPHPYQTFSEPPLNLKTLPL